MMTAAIHYADMFFRILSYLIAGILIGLVCAGALLVAVRSIWRPLGIKSAEPAKEHFQ